MLSFKTLLTNRGKDVITRVQPNRLIKENNMDISSARVFMKECFEKLYTKLSEEAPVALKMCDLPDDMLADGADPAEEWNTWKLIPSAVTDEDIAGYEKEYGLKFPNCVKAFFSTCHHCFCGAVGRNMSDEPLAELDNAFNPHLTANGYLPFAWDVEGYYIRCVDLANMPDEENCPVVQFPHEELFDLQYEFEDNGEEIPGKQLEELAERVSDNFYAYLNSILDSV